jgi:xanthine dehydrogenase YagR molybdenum-binding subunit
MSSTMRARAIGADVERRDARAKVSGEARYAYEVPTEGVAYASLVQARVARGRVVGIDVARARALPGVLAVLSYENAPRLRRTEAGELFVLQEPRIAYYGQVVAAVVAETLEISRDAAELVEVTVEQEHHDVTLRLDHPGLYRPEQVAFRSPESRHGDVDAAVANAPVVVDETYTTPAEHNMPMEPHSSLAIWDDGGLTVYESTQFPHGVRTALAESFGIDAEQVRVVNQHVGGGFGSKGSARPQVIVAAMAARATARPVKIALTRREMFPLSGHRSPTIQRIRLGSLNDGTLTAWEHVAYAQTSQLNEFCEPSTTGTRVMYAAENRFNTHRVVRLDVPSPGFCRAPGEAPGFFALECALDELAERVGVDPVELRIRNEPDRDPDTGEEFSSRGLVECLHEGAMRFGWWERAPVRSGRLLVGHGVASSMYPAFQAPSTARATARPDGSFVVSIAATDVGTGARTALAQIAAEGLGVDVGAVDVELGDSSLPWAIGAFGSVGTASWGHAITLACRSLREQLDAGVAPEQASAIAGTADALEAREPYSRHSFGAEFAEVAVDADTGEIRVTRLLGVFAAGRIVNPRTARSQLLGGMTWGLSMALHEHAVMDDRDGDFVTKDLASYHIATCADLPEVEVHWIDERDPHLNPMGVKGIGEIGIVGTAAAIANAVYDATRVRVRELPITLDKLLPYL